MLATVFSRIDSSIKDPFKAESQMIHNNLKNDQLKLEYQRLSLIVLSCPPFVQVHQSAFYYFIYQCVLCYLDIDMNKLSQHINIILICANTIGFSAFSHQYIHTHLSLALLAPFFLSLFPIKHYPSFLRSIYCLIAALAVIAVFLQKETAAAILISICLGLALCVGYHQVNRLLLSHDQIQIKIYEGAINLSLALGVFLSTFKDWIHLTPISAKLFVLIASLANFYLPIREFHSQLRVKIKEKQVESKMAYSLNPFYLKEWTYAIGFAVGVYLNLSTIFVLKKHMKYLIVALLLLIEVLTQKKQFKLASELLRAVLIYHFEKSNKALEAYFIFIFLSLRIYFSEDQLNLFLLVSYFILALYLWRSEYQQARQREEHQQLIDRSRLEIQMSLIKTGERIPSRFGKRKNSIK